MPSIFAERPRQDRGVFAYTRLPMANHLQLEKAFRTLKRNVNSGPY
jgi:hypothetical protein